MKLFPGLPLFRWAETSKSRTRAKGVLADLLSACFRLDAIGLDHGELSHAPKNVLVSLAGEPCIVDFESASTTRRVANVTSLLQYFLFGSISKKLGTPMLSRKRKEVVRALGVYKRDTNVENFQTILEILRLH
jgi:putative serine/threonine protein kinase